MPGVPSSKGCVACVKQKKKCDQAKPACSRCHRLQIPCIGSGKQRYKFVEFSQKASSSSSSSPCSSSTPSSLRSSPARSPSNESTLVVAEFAHKLEIKDLRYDLCWSYGELLKEIPRRLGTNAALDAAASALSCAFSGLSNPQLTEQTYARFGQAVRVLRLSLADPGFVYTPETLCAIFLIWICQSWFGTVDDMSGHGRGIVRVLSTMQRRGDLSHFEQLLFITIVGPVAFESLYDPETQLNPWLKAFAIEAEKSHLEKYDDKLTYGPKRIKYIGYLTCLIRLPEYLEYDPSKLREIEELYAQISETNEALSTHVHVHAAKAETSGDIHPNSHQDRQYALCQRTYALYLALEVILVAIIQVYTPNDVSLDHKSSRICREMMELSMQGADLRPLGSGWIAICLASAWVAAQDENLKGEIAETWDRCRLYPSSKPLNGANCLFGTALDRLRFAALEARMRSSSKIIEELAEWNVSEVLSNDLLPGETEKLLIHQSLGWEDVENRPYDGDGAIAGSAGSEAMLSVGMGQEPATEEQPRIASPLEQSKMTPAEHQYCARGAFVPI